MEQSEGISQAPQGAVPRAGRTPRRRLGLAGQTLFGLALGIVTGLFFGEYCESLKPLADAVVALLQMAILPYIVVSLPARIGSLSVTQTWILVGRGGAVLLVLWGVTILVAMLIPLSFPQWESGSFFSSTLTAPPPKLDFVSLLIPANPFRAMSENVVSAVVVFSVALGAGLIGMPGKDNLISVLKTLSNALSRVSRFAAYLTPLGVFAISAHAAGTLTFEEIERLKVFVLAFVVAASVLILGVLPFVVSCFTPCTFWQVLGASRQAVVTAFAIDNLFIALPLLEEDCRRLLNRAGLAPDRVEAKLNVLIPIGFALPSLGKLLRLLFIPFAAWNSGTVHSASDISTLAVYGPLSMFGSVHVAIPFLLDVARIPVDEYQLYLVARIVTSRFGEALSTMGLLAFSVLTVCALQGGIVTSRFRLVLAGGVSTLLVVGTVIGLRAFFSLALTEPPTTRELIASRRLVSRPVPAVVHTTVPMDQPQDRRPGEPLMAAIRRRGFLRVGFNPDNLPFSYFNGRQKLVGFDIDMAHTLARELKVSLEFIPLDLSQMAPLLADGRIDTVMSGVWMSTDRLSQMRFSEPYLDGTVALVVPDYRRDDFKDWETLNRKPNLSLAIWATPSTTQRLQDELPRAQIAAIDPPSEYFEDPHQSHDALVIVGESGAAWTLVYPQYTLVVPQPALRIPLAYPVGETNGEWAELLSRWISIHRDGPDFRRFYNYWISGDSVSRRTPRWSVLKDVLGWVP